MKRIFKFSAAFMVLSMAVACAKTPGYDFGEDDGTPDSIDGTELADDTNLFGQITDQNGNPVSGVAVSDGRTVVTTDANGVYQMSRSKLSRYVFYTTPAGYEINRADDGYPLFYQTIDQTQRVARNDFKLTALDAPETNFKLICIADPQCKTADNVSRYRSETVPDVEETAQGYLDAGIPVYGVTLGDIIFDSPEIWEDMKATMENLNIPVFQTIGNHDHLQNVGSESEATENYEKYLGPRDYSFDRGDAHIVVMDNVIYKGGAGGANYDGGITDAQLAWLEADLALVPKSKLVIFCAHIPFRDMNDSENESQKNGQAVIDLLSEFAEAHLMIGHTHYNENWVHQAGGKSIVEHIHGAACGAWWASTFCVDGSPNGYAVYNVDGASIDGYYYKGTDRDDGLQMRAYPGTAVFGTQGTTTFGWGANTSTYNDPKCIVVNVWNAIVPSRLESGADSDLLWKVELYQGGSKVCDMTAKNSPEWWAYGNFVINYAKSGSTYSNNRTHMYYGNLRSGDALNDTDEELDFEIKVTDQFGKVYTCSKLNRSLAQ